MAHPSKLLVGSTLELLRIPLVVAVHRKVLMEGELDIHSLADPPLRATR